jgi:predicted small integral membrane protein
VLLLGVIVAALLTVLAVWELLAPGAEPARAA